MRRVVCHPERSEGYVRTRYGSGFRLEAVNAASVILSEAKKLALQAARLESMTGNTNER